MSDPSDLQRVLGASSLPAAFSRERRVELLAEAFKALIDGRLPSREAALFAGGGGMAWLHEGGNLTRDYWRVSAPAGSHHTEARVWRSVSSSRGAQGESDDGSMPASPCNGDADADA